MTTTNAIGLDLSMTASGVALPDGTTITIKPKGDGDRRLLYIRDAIWQSVKGSDALIVLEDMPARLMANAAKAIGFVHGAVRSLLLEEGFVYVPVSPATLKAYATGKGNADKTAMAIAALKRGGREFGDDNQCDAWWLRHAGLDRLGIPEFTLPQAQRDRLDKVIWPEQVIV
ncbi:Holliday junction endonuclease [Streptomyces sp. V4-01]|uniref:Holliday junction endonuclease n=1 Tax=Actinacidiphila polyblastidii TaxID=3110430 RepID=A0ABU7P571_9ACTN|nr:Holliday junction endonuclease [Streptomyces sp. V4-01]